jgi:hypothetical protein
VVIDIFYISRRAVGIERALAALDRCLEDFELVTVDRALIEAACRLTGNDFEDKVHIACAQVARLDLIVARHVAGLAHSTIPTIEPAAVIGYLTR